jgi:hypothetical protein
MVRKVGLEGVLGSFPARRYFALVLLIFAPSDESDVEPDCPS